MHPIIHQIESNGIIARLRWWTLRWLQTWASEISMSTSRWTDQLQVKLDAQQEGRHD